MTTDRTEMPANLREWPTWLKSALLLGFWSLPGLLLSSQAYFMFYQEGRPVSWWRLVLWQLPGWYYWAAAMPVIFWLGRRLPIARPGWPLRALAHVGLAVLAVLLHAAYATLLTKLLAPEPYRSYSAFEFYFFFLLQRVHIGLLTYGGILGIGYGLDSYRKYRERELQASRLEAQLAQAQLQALKMQLHPHFLFNTLHAISVLVRKRANEQAVRMLAGLSDLLRLALETVGTQEVSLKQELEFLGRYLELQQIRFQDRLQVRMSIDDDTLDARIPNLILQPLVENAIRHGIAPRATAGLVEIRASRELDNLRVEVRDDGPGLPASGALKPAMEGVGLTNAKKRLRRLYGANHRFDLTNAEPSGAVAILEIPFRLAGAEA